MGRRPQTIYRPRGWGIAPTNSVCPASETPVPRTLIETIETTSQARELLLAETDLIKSLKIAPAERRLGLRNELEQLKTKMSAIPELEELMVLRYGRAETLQGLNWLFEETTATDQIVLVDWFSTGNHVYITIVTRNREPVMEEILCDVDLDKWVNIHLSSVAKSTLKLPDESSPLRELDSLVEPLNRLASRAISSFYHPVVRYISSPFMPFIYRRADSH